MRVSIELKKSILMIFLLLLGVFQMGILWSDKSSGVPFPFLSQSYWPKAETVKIDEVKGLYIHPKRIVVSDGGTGITDGNGKYWPLSSDSDAYKGIWADVSTRYLKQILEKKPDSENTSDWDTIMKKKCIILEFKNPIPVGILQWMSGTEKPVFPPFKEVRMIAVFPESIKYNYNQSIVYLTDDGEKAYEYIVDNEGGMKKEDYIALMNGIEGNNAIIPMTLVGTYHPVKNDDLLTVLSDKKEEQIIWDLALKTPKEIVLLQRDDVDTIQEILLDSGSKYTEFKDDAGPNADRTEVLFSDDEKIVRYYQNGFLDYRFREMKGAKGTVEEAFEKAVAFIEVRRKKIIYETDINLCEVVDSQKEQYYKFTFDYIFDNMDIEVLDEQTKTIGPVITICANRERVLDVKWHIKTLEYNDYHNYYNLNFYDFYENQLVLEPRFGGQIQDISIRYLYSDYGMRAEPYWLVVVDTDQKFYLKMRGEVE